tara:strand:- start:611 stop:868 length:258 start_codon:yes stop_codon:yes gene_type:complete
MLTVSVIKDNGRLVPPTLLAMLLNTTAVPMLLAQRILVKLLLLVAVIGKQFLRQEQQVALAQQERQDPRGRLAPRVQQAQLFLMG